MSTISNWSVTAASNNSAAPDGFPEAMAPSAVNNSARELMASVRTFYESIEWRDWGHTITYASATSFTTAAGDGDTTAVYHAGRRVHANGALTGDIYGTISSSSHAAQTTVNITWDSGSLQNEALTIELGWAVDQYSGDGIPSGSKILFYASAAPVGWTIDTTVDDKFVIIDDENGATTGGTDAPASTYDPGDYTPTGTNTAESSHTHGAGSYAIGVTSQPSTTGGINVADTGDPITGTSGAGSSHNHTWTASNSYNPATFAAAYAAFILCTKD